MATIQVGDKYFEPFITAEQISSRVKELSAIISDDYRGRKPVFLAILNGSFIFAADLFRHLDTGAEIAFVRLSSYSGTSSTGNVVTALGLNIEPEGRDLIILEDIIDTGKTLHSFIPELQKLNPASVSIATLLQKPEALQFPVQAKYVGFEIPDRFVLGYGLDYDGLGRNLPEIYQLCGE